MACGSIWPKIIKYDCQYITPNSGVSEGFAYYTIVGAAPWAKPRRIELPIFRPNDFFWKTHVREGEQKWECYRRVMQDLMSKYSGLPLSPLSIEDKFKYKDLIYPTSEMSQKFQ